MGASSSSVADNNTFFANIKHGLVPEASSITFEGFINSYFFDTGVANTKLVLEPSFSYAHLPFSNDIFLTIGLNSVYDNNPPRRKQKLLFLLDISGSMAETFSSHASQGAVPENKLDVAKKSLITLATMHLQAHDHMAVYSFDDIVECIVPLQAASSISRESITSLLTPLKPRGGTNMEKGITSALEVLQKEKNSSNELYEYRVIVLTDMNANLGDNSPNSLRSTITHFSEQSNIYVTYIGIGLDFNTNLATSLAGIKGGNYFSVSNELEFRKKMEEEFDYMISPVAFDTIVTMDSKHFSIEAVYGVPGSQNASPNQVLYMKNIFPTPKDNSDNVKGGVILVKLKQKDQFENSQPSTVRLDFTTSCVDFEGNNHTHSNYLEIDMESINKNSNKQQGEEAAPFYESSGIQKAILLYQLMQCCQAVIKDMKEKYQGKFLLNKEEKQKVKEFHDYFVKQIEELGDKSMAKELELLVKFMDATEPEEVAKQEEEWNKKKKANEAAAKIEESHIAGQ